MRFRALFCVVFSLLAGGLISACLPLVFLLYGAWLDKTGWPKFEAELLAAMGVFAVPGTINGVIGAIAGWGTGKATEVPVLIVPALLPLSAIIFGAIVDPGTICMFLWISAIAALFSWISGRIGQSIGCRLRPGNAQT
jgi:hypothetical protein